MMSVFKRAIGRSPGRALARASLALLLGFITLQAISFTMTSSAVTTDADGLPAILVPYLSTGSVTRRFDGGAPHGAKSRYEVSLATVSSSGEGLLLDVQLNHLEPAEGTPVVFARVDEGACDLATPDVTGLSDSTRIALGLTLTSDKPCSLQIIVREGAFEDAFWFYVGSSAGVPQLLSAEGYLQKAAPTNLEYTFSTTGTLQLAAVHGPSRGCLKDECTGATGTTPVQAVPAAAIGEPSDFGLSSVDPEDLENLFQE